MNDCPRSALVSALMDGELSTDESEQFTAHLQGCFACSRELEGLRVLHSTLMSLPSDPSASARVLERVTASSRRRPLFSYQIKVPWALAASILLLFGLSMIANAYFVSRPREVIFTGGASVAPVSGNQRAATQEPREGLRAPRQEAGGSPPGAPVRKKSSKPTESVRTNPKRSDPQAKPSITAPSDSPQVTVVIASQDSRGPVYQILSGKAYHLNPRPVIHVGTVVSPED